MVSDAALAWSYIHVLTKKRYDALVEVFGGLEQALPLLGMPMLRELGLSEEASRNALLRYEDFNAHSYRALLEAEQIRFITIEDPAYPPMLGRTSDPPIFLYIKGDLSIVDQPCIGLVGTREMTPYGQRVAYHFTEEFVRAGMVTVSGLADGIDTAIAKETLRSGGKSVGVLGHGFAIMFPASNMRLSEEIVHKGGLLLTEFPYDYGSSKLTFPARNRIIAGLSLGTVVLEAPADSGAIITAEFALEENREVFAVPGPVFEPTYEGCHALIAAGRARLVSTPQEVLREIGIIAPSEEGLFTYEPQNDDERAVYGVLSTMPQPIDDLVERTGLPAGQIGVALTMMELADAVRNVGGGQWVRR